MKETIHLAPAKINLSLEVLHQRADGFHEINTIFHKVEEPHDIISVGPSTSYLLTTNDRSLDTGSTNLVTRAVKAVADVLEEKMPRCNIHLAKRIPTGAGLGGGSSDAAVALNVAHEIFGARLKDEDLFELGKTLGADVPFFLSPYSTAVATGIGEVLTPLDLRIAFHILIVKPPTISVSTKEAYESLQLRPDRRSTEFASVLGTSLQLDAAKQFFHNDFEEPLFVRHTELPALKEWLYALGADHAQMTGSGSAFYALFADGEIAKRAAGALKSEGAQVFYNKPQKQL